MSEQPSRISAIAGERCPRCRKGPVYRTSIWNILRFGQMYDDCPHCGQHYEVEPGFFWGAMYIGYAITCTTFIGVSAGLYLFLNPEFWVYFAALGVAFVLLVPVNIRLSRILMLHLFSGIKYEQGATAVGVPKSLAD